MTSDNASIAAASSAKLKSHVLRQEDFFALASSVLLSEALKQVGGTEAAAV
jgi:hypothetical protein